MRIWIAITLLGLHSLALLKPLAPVLYFHLQQDYITQELCEERFEEMSFCGGKCVLQKALQQEFDEQEQPQERSEWRLQWLEHPSLLKPLPALAARFAPSLLSEPQARPASFLPADYSAVLEKPPRLV